jgi:hypothetical protein
LRHELGNELATTTYTDRLGSSERAVEEQG